MIVYSTTTSFGGIDAETGDSHTQGETTSISQMPSAGSRVTEDDYQQQYGQYINTATVTRHGSKVAVNSMSDYQGSDIVSIDDGTGSPMELTVDMVRQLGMEHLLEDHVYGTPEDGESEVDAFLRERGALDDADDSIDNIYRENLQDAVQAGEMGERLAHDATLLADRAALAGYDAQQALDAAAHVINTGDYSVLTNAGFDQAESEAMIGGLYNSMIAEAENVIGNVGVAELNTLGNRYPEVREMMLRTGMGMLQGTHEKQAFKSLHKILMNEYGGRG